MLTIIKTTMGKKRMTAKLLGNATSINPKLKGNDFTNIITHASSKEVSLEVFIKNKTIDNNKNNEFIDLRMDKDMLKQLINGLIDAHDSLD